MLAEISESQEIKDYSSILVRLIQGAVYSEDKIWEPLLQYRGPVQEYFSKIGIDVHIFEGDGFAYLRQKDFDSETEHSLPRLIRRIPLTYEVTLLLVLLRDRLHQFDIEASDSTRLILSKEDIRELVVVFF